jgi:hypothetical protein
MSRLNTVQFEPDSGTPNEYHPGNPLHVLKLAYDPFRAVESMFPESSE